MSLSASSSLRLRPDRRAVTWTCLLLLALGSAIALSWSARAPAPPVTAAAEADAARPAIARLEAKQRQLKEQIAGLRARLAAAQQRQTAAQTAAAELQPALQAERMLAGLTPRSGPGLRLTLDDSSSPAPLGAAANDYIVHDTDMRDVINVLWAAGAQAIAVNGERLVATSSVVCVGTVIIVNDVRLAPPYTVTAIGDISRLATAVDGAPQLAGLRGRARDLGLQFTLAPSGTVDVPAYTGRFTLRYAEAP